MTKWQRVRTSSQNDDTTSCASLFNFSTKRVLKRALVVAVLVSLCAGIYFDVFYNTAQTVSLALTESLEREFIRASNQKLTVFDKCVLKEYPAWTPELRLLLNPHYDPLENCTRSWVARTVLGEDGIVRIHDNYQNATGEACWARSLEWYSDRRQVYGEWHAVEENYKFDVDIVETKCTNASGQIFYRYLHHQIVRKDEPENVAENSKTDEVAEDYKPSVYVLLFDSVSYNQALRTFPKTLAYIEKEFGSVGIRHMNKVGENSQPNAFALLYGKIIAPIYREMYGLPHIDAEWGYFQYCDLYMNTENFVISDFEKYRNYKTMMAEDYFEGVFNYPSCAGFRKVPTTHYMRPFQNRLSLDMDPVIMETMSKAHCHEEYVYPYYYLEQFIKAYPDEPKFGFIWGVFLSHDSENNVFHSDKFMAEYFERNKEEFDKSFVIFMGDHGFRLGDEMWTDSGQFETNNPMLWMSVPRSLRESTPVLENMRKNSEQLSTMLDLHATLADILKVLPISNFTDYSTVPMQEGTKGHSFLRPFPDTPRNCKTLPIEPEYCLCDMPKTKTNDGAIMSHAGLAIVKAINTILHNNWLENQCHTLKLHEVVEMSKFDGTEDIYEARIVVTPGRGEFLGLVQNNGNRSHPDFRIVNPSPKRMNRYRDTANCVSSNFVRYYCYCRDYVDPNAPSTSSPALGGTLRTVAILAFLSFFILH